MEGFDFSSWRMGIPSPRDTFPKGMSLPRMSAFTPTRPSSRRVTLRIYSRLRVKQFGWDDILISLAMARKIPEVHASMRTAYLGVHVYDIPRAANLSDGMMWNYVIQILYNPILALVKGSVLLFILRIGGHRRSIRYSIHVLNIFNSGLAVGIFITVIFQCKPIPYFWERVTDSTLKGTCVDTGAFYVSTAALTILTDLLVLALPRLKFALMSVFLLGAVVTVISTLRLVWLVGTSLFPPPEDFTYNIRFTYSAVETNLAIMAASGPALRPLFTQYGPGGEGMSGDRSRKLRTNGSRHQFQYGMSSFVMKDMKRQTTGENSPTASKEEILAHGGIVQTTEVDVEYGKKPSSTQIDDDGMARDGY
ncbi:uncharacterized protein BCR38DRAFT_456273 [Pseudomassariella vexata]|uniref:Rhodopsin domain-containing protein n=1 Tax=Pseudomassariella vexata TaxID=1141098 RepID=A0A1Y2E7M0_9PEZI|nr:uncharacterized protein BCR38DRAFT_456273 [Pseudomassariella vexata]ORY67539.1 hypothetical protein BCR38DRAFT_456273 [Pseudomassariella vexata]